jgi:histone H3
MMDIEREQSRTTTSIDPDAFASLTASIAATFKSDLRFEPEAFEALQEAAEGYLVGLFEEAMLVGVACKRTYIKPSDLQLVRRIRGERA